jgi:hypothetical protein
MILVVWGASFLGLTHYRFFGPRYESARREIFTETPSYVMGKRQFLSRLYREWEGADESHKSAICETARHEAVTLKPSYIPDHLQKWECVK